MMVIGDLFVFLSGENELKQWNERKEVLELHRVFYYTKHIRTNGLGYTVDVLVLVVSQPASQQGALSRAPGLRTNFAGGVIEV